MAAVDKILTERTIRRQAAAHAEWILADNGPVESDLSDDNVSVANYFVSDSDEEQENVSNSISNSDHVESDNPQSIYGSDYHDDSDVMVNYSSEEEGHEQPEFKEQLKEWAINSGTPHCHINSLLAILKPHFPLLPKDSRTLLHTQRSYLIEDIAGGKYHHFGIANGINAHLQQYDYLRVVDELSLQLNIDGLPLFKSSSESFWPILAIIRQEDKPEPFVIGLWVGLSKPDDSNTFLQGFINEMSEIEVNGVTFDDKIYKIKIENFVCDTPARSFVKKTKGHCGYYGCDYCVQSGVYYQHRMTFPERDAAVRTDVTFDEMLCEEHHRGDTSLKHLNLGLVSQFPLDYMHLVCLGIMKKMFAIWINGPLNVRLGNNIIRLISDAIMNLKPYLPREFIRKGRPLSEVDRWKATEFRTFLLYTGHVALRGKIPDVLYKHFLMFYVGLTILSSAPLCAQYCDYAEELLSLFVKHFGDTYGQQMLIYNVHCLIHLASHCKQYGTVHNFSGFPFQNYLQAIKELIRKPQFPLQQAIRRLTEHPIAAKTRKTNESFCKKRHYRGPIPDDLDNAVCTQYEQLHMPKYILSITKPDNAILIGNNLDTYVIQNIIIHNNLRKIMCKKFTKKESFFMYPLDSCRLNITYVSNLGQNIVQLDPFDITAKVVLLPFNDGFVSTPMLQ